VIGMTTSEIGQQIFDIIKTGCSGEIAMVASETVNRVKILLGAMEDDSLVGLYTMRDEVRMNHNGLNTGINNTVHNVHG
jgi:hypothetical protein